MPEKTVLLVDDVRLFLNLEETFFRRTGCRILTAMSGEEALEIAKAEKPDIVLLDYVMPGIAGDEVCRRVKDDPNTKDTIVIMVTTKGDEKDTKLCRDAGCDDIVLKPINQRELLEKVARYLDIEYRVHFRILIRIEVEGRWRDGFFMGEANDLSRSGMLLTSDAELKVGERINVQFVVPGSREPISVTGSVARVTADNEKPGKFLIGLEFEDLEPEIEQAITNYIDSRRDMSN